MSSALRSVVVFAFLSTIAVLTVPGCAEQGEGERCDSTKNGDLDCDSGLTCVRKIELVDGTADRCCPAMGAESDKRCIRGMAPEPEPTTPDTSTPEGTAGAAGATG